MCVCVCVCACMCVCVHVCVYVCVLACMCVCVCVCVCERYDLAITWPAKPTEIKLGLKILWHMRFELGNAMANTSFTNLIHTIVV